MCCCEDWMSKYICKFLGTVHACYRSINSVDYYYLIRFNLHLVYVTLFNLPFILTCPKSTPSISELCAFPHTPPSLCTLHHLINVWDWTLRASKTRSLHIMLLLVCRSMIRKYGTQILANSFQPHTPCLDQWLLLRPEDQNCLWSFLNTQRFAALTRLLTEQLTGDSGVCFIKLPQRLQATWRKQWHRGCPGKSGSPSAEDAMQLVLWVVGGSPASTPSLGPCQLPPLQHFSTQSLRKEKFPL